MSLPTLRLSSLLLAAALLTGTCCFAQEPTTTLKVSARLVVLDVTATDASGKVIPGLTAKDFAVEEEGHPQRIVSFESFDQHQLPVTADRNTVFDPAVPATFGSSPVAILVLDEVNTHFADTAYAVHSLQQYLNAQPERLKVPTTLAVVSDKRIATLCPYTLDRQALLTVLAAHKPMQAWQLEQSMSNGGEGVADRLDRSIAALEQLAQNAAGIPGHKTLIWVGAGFPTVDPQALTPQTDAILKGMLQHTTDTLLNNRITLFAVDPTTTAASNTEITDADQLEFALASGATGLKNMMDPFDRTLDFDRLGPATGGSIIRNRNDVDVQVANSVNAGTSFYTLAYRPTSDSDTAKDFRHIKVTCLRPGLKVHSPIGYYRAVSSTVRDRDSIGYDLNNAATAEILFHALTITVDKGTGPDTYVAHIPATQLSWHDGASTSTASVQVLAVALSAKRKVLAHTLQSETATAMTETEIHIPGKTARFEVSLPIPAGAATLRFVLRDQTTGHMGSIDVPIPPK